ncbi:MAG: pantetheine-phosphate adenylyltransferase [Deltaproteobacteria bacterium]|nr:pantetheine-phosphate adenylyltransferase [Deltaproteobacteria bacterium]
MSAQPLSFSTGIYVGTFDPLTNGHCDVIERASYLFQSLTVGIGDNVKKKPFFSVKERIAILKSVCTSLNKNISVKSFKGLAVEFAKSEGASVMVRGLRTEADYEFEMQMVMMNKTLCDTIETVFIPTRQELSHISSSLVREVAVMGGDVSKLVPDLVFKKLKEKQA